MIESAPAGRRRWIPAPLWLAALASLSILNQGYRVYCDNHALQLPLIQRTLDAGLFPGDPFVDTLTDYVSWFWWGVAYLARLVDLEALLFVLFASTRLLLVVSCARLGAALAPGSPTAAFGAAALASLAPESILGDGNLTEVYFEQSSLFMPLFLLALASLLEGRSLRFVLLWGLAFLVNPMYGVWAGLFFAGTYLADPQRPQLRRLLKVSPIFFLMVTPIVVHGLRALSRPKPASDLWAWEIRLLNSPHLAPSTWYPAQFRAFALFVLLALSVGLLMRRRDSRAWSLAAAWSLLAMVFLGLGLAVGGSDRWLEIMVLQPVRATDFSYLAAGVLIVATTAGLAVEKLAPFGPLWFTLCFAATGHLLSPAFRDHALWPFLVSGLLASAYLATRERRARRGAAAGLPSSGEATSRSGPVDPHRSRAPAIVALAAVAGLVAALGGLAQRARDRGDLLESLYRRPDPQLVEIADWARTSTAADAVFLHDPISWEWAQFRYLAQRPVYATWKDASAVLWAPAYAEEWSRRFAAFGFRGRWRDRWDISRRGEIRKIRQSLRYRYKRLTDADLQAMRSEFRIDYWISPVGAGSALSVAFATADYKVLEVDPGPQRHP